MDLAASKKDVIEIVAQTLVIIVIVFYFEICEIEKNKSKTLDTLNFTTLQQGQKNYHVEFTHSHQHKHTFFDSRQNHGTSFNTMSQRLH